ncbi:MAG TPA: glycosyl hydrolase family 18 protein [Candidatus Limnocylindrales bacterium]|nr:glycosyl hydrolase family 18 protein [Candidatus Limnocylindrales bacterium]
MSTGFRRSLTRHGARTVTAIVAIAIAGLGGWASPSAGEPRAASERTAVAAPHVRVVADADIDAGGTAPAAALASFDERTADPTAEPATDAAAPDAAGLLPSIQYEEAEKHANDKIDFAPGGRVTVGFQPRPSDTWTVGGGTPRALPAGRLDGKAIRGQGQASSDAVPAGPEQSVGPDVPVDQPAGEPAAIDATETSWAGTDPAAGTPTTNALVTANGLRREIFGFLPYWQVNSSTLRLDYARISTIAYFGVGADAAGNLQKRNADGTTTVGWAGWTSSKMSSIISTAHANRTRVVLTVQSFAWNASGQARQQALLESSTARLNLARQIAAAVRDRGADGVNLDFEPLVSGYSAQFTALVRSVRAELNRVAGGYQLTFDTTGSIGNYPIENATAPGGADAIFIMGYDYRTASSSPVGSIAPLSRTGYDIRDTVAAYTARVAPSKLILGVPYYGRAWSTATDTVHASNTSSTKTGASTTVVYSTAMDYLAEYGRRWASTEQVAWTAYQRENCTTTYGCVTSWRQLYVDDAAALSAKYDLVNAYNLRGAGIWALGYDGTRTELWAAIQRKFITDTTAPVAGVRNLPTRQANPGFTVAWTGRDDVAVASYDVQISTDGGPWATWLTATKATSAPLLGVDHHAYAFRVRARDARGNVSAWNVTAPSVATNALAVGGFGTVRIDGLSKRSAPDTTATKTGTFDTGDLVAIVAGPRSADGYTWFQVRGPLTEWGIVTSPGSAAWVATGSSTQTWLSPARAPYGTTVAAAIGDLGYGDGGAASIGTGSTALAERAFSPNGDGVADRMAIDWTNDRAFEGMALKVFRADGTLAGTVALDQVAAGARQVGWDGRIGTTALPNGRYLVTVLGSVGGTTFYNPSLAFSGAALATHGITIDTVAPVATAASIGGTLVSPNGDGILDTVRVSLTASGANRWTFSAAPVSGTTVGAAIAIQAGTGGAASVAWDGRTDAGAVAPDGTYRLTLAAHDLAGNKVVRSWNVRLDTTPATLGSSATPDRFSPNGDGAADTTRLAWSSSERITGSARIYRGTTLVRSWSIANLAAGAITWNGTDAAGKAVADGSYTFRVAGRDAAGVGTSRNIPLVVDRTLSTVRWSRSFLPQDGDALMPSSRLTFTLKRSASVSVAIFSGSRLVRTVWTDRALAAGAYGWTWDGRDAAGAWVAPGTYQARVYATTSLGTTAIGRTVLVDAFAVSRSAATLSAGQTLTLTLVTTEPLRAAPGVTLSQPGRAAVTRTATSLGSGRYRVTFTIASGPAGTAAIRIAARDTANGLNVSTTSVTIR